MFPILHWRETSDLQAVILDKQGSIRNTFSVDFQSGK